MKRLRNGPRPWKRSRVNAPGRKQLKELRERVTEELMPRAFTRRRTTYAWIDPTNGWFCVDASSPAKAEEVIEHLRHCLDELPLSMVHTQISPQTAMADWLAGGEAPAGFTIDRDCELKAAGEEKVGRALRQASTRRRGNQRRDQGSPGQRQVADQAGPDLG